MFGGMTISPVLKINPTDPLDTAVAALLRVAEDPEIVKWIEFANSLLLFAMVPDNLQSGLVARPGLLCSRLPWRLEMGKVPEARV